MDCSKVWKKVSVHKTTLWVTNNKVPKVDKTTYVRHKSRERNLSKVRNADVAVPPTSPAERLSYQDESKKVKSEKSTSVIKNMDQKPKSLHNRRESVCVRVDRQEQGMCHGQQDAKNIKVDKATYVRYRDKKHVKKQDSDTSINNRAQKSIRETVQRVDKSTYVRCHSHKPKNLSKQRITEKEKSKREETVNRIDESTFVRFSGIDQKPEMRTLSTGFMSMHLEAATQHSYDGRCNQPPREELGRPYTNVKTNKFNEDTQYTSKYEAELVEKAIRYKKRKYRGTFDTGTRTEDYLIQEQKQKDSPYQPKTVHPCSIPIKRKSNPVENSEIFIKQLDYEYNQHQHSQSFVVDFGTNAIQRLKNKPKVLTKNITSNFVEDEDYNEPYCEGKYADKKNTGYHMNCTDKHLCTKSYKQVCAEVGVQVGNIKHRRYVNKKVNNTVGAVQTILPQQTATEELIKCVEKYLCTNKYNQEYDDVGAQADVDEFHHTNKKKFANETVQTNFIQKHGGMNEKCMKVIYKNLSANNQQHVHVGVQKDMIKYKNRVYYINNALQTDFLDGNFIENRSKGVIQDLRIKDTNDEVGLQADFEYSQQNRSQIYAEQGVQAALKLEEHKSKCNLFTNGKNENNRQNIQEYDEQNLISKVFEEKEQQRRAGNFSITAKENIKNEKKQVVQCGVQSDNQPNIDKIKTWEEKNSNDSVLVSWLCSEQNILRVEKSAGDTQNREAETKIEAQNPVERLQLCACPEEEKCTNDCKLVEMKICRKENNESHSPNDDEGRNIELRIRECPTCEKEGFHNYTTGLSGSEGAPLVPIREHDARNKNDAINKKRERLKKEERETKRGKKGKFKTQDEPPQETCDPHICNSLEHLMQNIPCTKITKEVDNKRPIGIHIKYRSPQRKYTENYTQPDETFKDRYGRRSKCNQGCQGPLPLGQGELSGLDYYQEALNFMKKIEQNRRRNMSKNSYDPTFGPPTFQHNHWDNPCESIRTNQPRCRGAQSSSKLSDTNQNRFLGDSRSRSCKCLDVSSLGSHDEMETPDERSHAQPYLKNFKHQGDMASRPPLCPNMDRHYRNTHSPHKMQERHLPNYKYQRNPSMDRPCRDTERPHQFPTSSNETSDGSGIYLSREPYYQYQRKSWSETSDCYYKKMLRNALQQVSQYPCQGYETIPTSSDTKDAGCDPISELKQEKHRIWDVLFKRQCCRNCNKSQCKNSPQKVVDAATGPGEDELKPGGPCSPCPQRCKLTTCPLPSCRYITDMPLSQWEQIKGQGEGCWNASSHSCGNLLEYDHSNDFDWVPANYFIQAKSSISEGSSGFSMFIGGRSKESVYLVAEQEEECFCDMPSACRQLFMKLKQCCRQTYVPDPPPSEGKEHKRMVIPSRSQGFKLDVAGKGSQATGLRCCPDVKTRRNYSYRHHKL